MTDSAEHEGPRGVEGSGRYLADLSPGWTPTATESVCGKSNSVTPAFDAYVRSIPEIPVFVIDDYGCYFLRRKRNLFVSANFDDATFTRYNLVETRAILKLDRNYLITETCLPMSFQINETFLRDAI